MSGLVWVAVPLALVVGIGIGWLLRGWLIATGHTHVMAAIPRPRIPASLTRYSKPLGVALVVIALLSNAALGFLLIQQRAVNSEQDRRADATSACNQRYNELDGRARDEVASKSTAGTVAAIQLWTRLRDGIRTQQLTADQLDGQIGTYLGTLRGVNRSRLANPFPDPDMCSHVEPGDELPPLPPPPRPGDRPSP